VFFCFIRLRFTALLTFEMRFAFVLLMTLLGLNGQEVWWSMQPLERPKVPPGPEKVIVDRFIRAKQKRLGIVSAGAAEKRVLARRLAFDLWGMPLPPKRVDTFVRDKSPRPIQSWWMNFWLHLDMVNAGRVTGWMWFISERLTDTIKTSPVIMLGLIEIT
jgi:hypothetical protein